MKSTWTTIIIVCLLLISSCTYRPGPSAEEVQINEATQQALIEQAVRGTATTSAMLTQIAVLETQIAQMTQSAANPTATATIVPTNTLLPPTATQPPPTPTNTVVPPTATPVPATATPLATATATVPCNKIKFEGDVTIPDGTTFSPGTSFTKTWRLRNSGSCTWTTAYDLIYFKGDQMEGPLVMDFPANVGPGEVIDLSINLVAPYAAGNYRGYWLLRDASGIVFGLGKQGDGFYADIRVTSTTLSVPVDLAEIYCSAEWTNGVNNLACPGKDGDGDGFVLRFKNPVLESGYVDDELALLTSPQLVNNGMIRGKFPIIRVESGYRFSAVIGCTHKATGCDVTFQLDYQIAGGSISTLQSWHEIYDEKFVSVNADLSSLAGKDVRFILTILSNGSPSNDRALWLAPRIHK